MDGKQKVQYEVIPQEWSKGRALMTRFRPIAEPQMAQHEQSSVMAFAEFQYLQESLYHVKLTSSAVASR
jgi:hypothetical protein